MENTGTLTVVVSEDGVQGELIYTLLRDVILIEEACVPVYGVAVSFMSGSKTELCKIHNVTPDMASMAAFMSKMAQGMVFPVSLADIIEDFIA